MSEFASPKSSKNIFRGDPQEVLSKEITAVREALSEKLREAAL